MYVIRAENAKGQGPYDSHNVANYATHEGDEFPAPWEEFPFGGYRDMVCSCENLDRYMVWFPEEWREFFVHRKFKANVYKVNKISCLVGEKQVMFPKDRAEKVASFKATDIKGIRKFMDKKNKS